MVAAPAGAAHADMPLRRGGSGRELTLPRRRRQGSPPIFTHQTESMIPQLTTASPMRKSRIAMMVSMELASSWTTTQEKQARALDRCRRNMDTDSWN